ncbi:hypothetical protein N8314_00660 [Akkermansiaceae bacterium]|nr:hypothetical protein [Akkermansiaceae bacterium]
MTDEISRGNAARRILEDDAFKDAVAEYSRQITLQWSQAKTVAVREELHAQQLALTNVVNNLSGYMQSADFLLRKENKDGFFK